MNINFENLVSNLTANMSYKNGEIIKQLKFQVNTNNGNYCFAKEVLPNCIVVEDWSRYYKFDAAKEYVNPSVFVAECLIEEVQNKFLINKEYNEFIDELINKHK